MFEVRELLMFSSGNILPLNYNLHHADHGREAREYATRQIEKANATADRWRTVLAFIRDKRTGRFV
jgi:hypothetical protein